VCASFCSKTIFTEIVIAVDTMTIGVCQIFAT
jgi:hypothetical protein